MKIQKTLMYALFLLLSIVFNSAAWSHNTGYAIYTDGSIKSVQFSDVNSDINGAISIEDYLGSSKTAGIPVNAYVRIFDDDSGREIQEIYPGQRIHLAVFFDPLGDWPINFESLVGKTLKPIFLTLGSFKFIDSRAKEVEADEDNLVGLGTVVTVPDDVQPGKFLFLGILSSNDLDLTDNIGWGIYSVGR